MSQKQIRVAIGLIVKNGQILVGWRDEKLHQGGCYEFPGGKIEADENGMDAVRREIREEVGIEVEVGRLFHELVFDYSDRVVHLYFYLCSPQHLHTMVAGWQWQAFDQLGQLTFPAANAPILARLDWSRRLAITSDGLMTNDKQLKSTVGLCYLRIDASYIEQAIHMFDEYYPAIKLIVQHDAYLALNAEQQRQVFAVHLNARKLRQTISLEALKNHNVIAACHDLQDVVKANLLGCDAILLSPVQPTSTHPDQEALGWEKFGLLAEHANMPVYALGGMAVDDLEMARQYGAYGVAGIGDFWL